MTKRNTGKSAIGLRLAVAAHLVNAATTFVLPVQTQHLSFRSIICESTTVFSKGHQFSEEEDACLKRRITDLRLAILDQEVNLPPNSDLNPSRVVELLLGGIQESDDPLPDAGFRRLFRSSTPRWRRKMYKSVGAPSWAREDLVASALGDAVGRAENQFEILVNEDLFKIGFPREPHYNDDDGTCWLECELRNKSTDALLVTIGLQMWERPSDGAWLLHRMDWQDFRERYRPGVGREDWMRDTMKRLGCL